MNIEQLLRAAEYLDRREREAEHGYASSLPMPEEYDSRKTKTSPPSKKSLGTRTTHNELEKLRPFNQLSTKTNNLYLTVLTQTMNGPTF
ncbi:MXD4 [Bugula neritina]|uniref:MXD4 n=1 Tax=Bugula neritina TaxID=10212 RepID=A0A7J7K0Y1_BUGNE|nr:MXD4 [Bugula neritina]